MCVYDLKTAYLHNIAASDSINVLLSAMPCLAGRHASSDPGRSTAFRHEFKQVSI